MLQEVCPKSYNRILDIEPHEELRSRISEDSRIGELYTSLRCLRKQRSIRQSFEYLLERSGLYRWTHLSPQEVMKRCRHHNLEWKMYAIYLRLTEWYDILTIQKSEEGFIH